MKLLITGIVALITLAVGFWGCNDLSRTTYSGSDYVMFSDTLSMYPVQDSEKWFEIPVVATNICDYDRSFGVEVDDKASNAIEKKQYVVESNTVTIKAGERVAKFRMKGIYENIDKTDSLSVTFNLLAKDENVWDLYGTRTRVQMQKACPFELSTFEGYCLLTSSFFSAYMTNTEYRLLQAERDKTEDNTIILHDFFYKNYDLKIKYDPSDPLKPFVEFDDQIIGSTAEAFGTIYGNGKLMCTQPVAYDSYYNVCQKFVFLYSTIYMVCKGTVGTYVNILEWISDEEAEQYKKEEGL